MPVETSAPCGKSARSESPQFAREGAQRQRGLSPHLDRPEAHPGGRLGRLAGRARLRPKPKRADMTPFSRIIVLRQRISATSTAYRRQKIMSASPTASSGSRYPICRSGQTRRNWPMSVGVVTLATARSAAAGVTVSTCRGNRLQHGVVPRRRGVASCEPGFVAVQGGPVQGR